MNKNRTLLLDRDGVINADVGYIGSIKLFSFLPGLFPFLRAARDLGYRMAIVTNQSGVARGYYTTEDYERLTEHMLDGLRREGIDIDLVLACFEHDQGVVPAFTRQSFWRKPQPGMVLEALRRLNGDPARAAFLGDAPTDMEAAIAGGIARRLWMTEAESTDLDGVIIVRNFDEALAQLKSFP